MISVVAQGSLAATLIDDGVALLDVAGLSNPMSLDLWMDDRVT